MQQSRKKDVVRLSILFVTMGIDVFLLRFFPLPYLFTLLSVCAADCLRAQPEWKSWRSWVRRILYSIAIPMIAYIGLVLYVLLFSLSDVERMISPGG